MKIIPLFVATCICFNSFLAFAWNAKSFAKPTDKQLKEKLSSIQYSVTQHEDTERPYKNEFWNHDGIGIYVDVVSGEPLFSSLEKFESSTGWPSFYKPLAKENIIEKTDKTLGMVRVEVRSKHANSHLGHLFDDGPKPTGLRYCINSAALRFVALNDLEKMGYGEYTRLFEKKNQPAK